MMNRAYGLVMSMVVLLWTGVVYANNDEVAKNLQRIVCHCREALSELEKESDKTNYVIHQEKGGHKIYELRLLVYELSQLEPVNHHFICYRNTVEFARLKLGNLIDDNNRSTAIVDTYKNVFHVLAYVSAIVHEVYAKKPKE